MTSITSAGRPVFSVEAVIAWGRSIGISDATALEFMRQEGAIITDENKVWVGARDSLSPHAEVRA